MEAPLEVTYRHGKPFAAYYRLPRRAGDRVERSQPGEAGLVVDLTADGRPIGIEITDPGRADLEAFNRLLRSLGLEPVDATALAPLHAA